MNKVCENPGTVQAHNRCSVHLSVTITTVVKLDFLQGHTPEWKKTQMAKKHIKKSFQLHIIKEMHIKIQMFIFTLEMCLKTISCNARERVNADRAIQRLHLNLEARDFTYGHLSWGDVKG